MPEHEPRKRQPLTDDMRKYYGMMAAYWQTQGTLNSEIQLCKNLRNCLEIGLYSEHRENEYIDERAEVAKAFQLITQVMQTRERRLYQESEITRLGNIITNILLPILICNRYIVLNTDSFENRPTLGNASQV
jgi:hypothetical protein